MCESSLCASIGIPRKRVASYELETMVEVSKARKKATYVIRVCSGSRVQVQMIQG
jgi:hypothetical protein